MKTSRLELDRIRSKTRVTRMVSRAPLRLLETGTHEDAVEIQLSSYGGGMLQGDRIGLNVRCGEATGLLLKSQANTHVYKNEIDELAVQTLHADCGDRTRVRILPEPVVLHAGAQFRQEQHWNISPTTDFVLADWMQSGRSESAEQFAFDRFESVVCIAVDGNPVLEERFSCCPATDDIRSPAVFGPFDLMMNVYLLGPSADHLLERLKPFLDFQQHHTDALPQASSRPNPEMLCALNPLPFGGHILRCLARTRRQLQPVMDVLSR
ncbi:urease accessory protein UreD [Pontiella agarivorans]|uniref:Urease accessory protein UreD n=1 Tax=Pontiella agarivorans TaxID=3038953 RepID=A0ABU5MWH5_9BACT|nr:urease accessory protein UreD [Pontiella agarivorans]MDZ8118544.1 urease accessory protein UreD [Pontiella agarivorans]